MRLETQSASDGEEGVQGEGRGEVAGGCVGAGRDAPEVPEAAEDRLDPPTVTVAPRVEPDLAVAGARNDHAGALLTQFTSQPGGGVARVGDGPRHPTRHLGQHGGRGPHGAGVAGDEADATPAADHVGEDVDRGGRTCARGADLPGAGPSLSAGAARGALTEVASRAAASPDPPAMAADLRVRKPERAPPWKRWETVVEGPYSPGQSVQRQPLAMPCTMPERMVRSSSRRAPGWLPGLNGAIARHGSSDSRSSSARASAIREALGLTSLPSSQDPDPVETLA